MERCDASVFVAITRVMASNAETPGGRMWSFLRAMRSVHEWTQFVSVLIVTIFLTCATIGLVWGGYVQDHTSPDGIGKTFVAAWMVGGLAAMPYWVMTFRAGKHLVQAARSRVQSP